MRTHFTSTFLALALGLALPAVSQADGSCLRLLAQLASEGSGGWYSLELTMHREDVGSVSYSGDTAGWLVPRPDGSFVGHSDRVFSDRIAGARQRFDIAYGEDINLMLERSGRLHISYSNPLDADTIWDLSCKGTLLTAYVPSFGVVTLAFRQLYAPAR